MNYITVGQLTTYQIQPQHTTGILAMANKMSYFSPIHFLLCPNFLCEVMLGLVQGHPYSCLHS